MKQSIMQSLFLIFVLVVGFSEDYHLLQKHTVVDGGVVLRPSVCRLPLAILFFSHLISRTGVHPQSHKHVKFLFLWLFRPCWQFLFSSCQRLQEKCVHKDKMAFKGGDILISGLGADIRLKAIRPYLRLVLSAARRLTSYKALSYFWGRGCNNIKARTH